RVRRGRRSRRRMDRERLPAIELKATIEERAERVVGPPAVADPSAGQLVVDVSQRPVERHADPSSAAAALNIVASAKAGASTWTPTGRPSSPVPNGTEIAG